MSERISAVNILIDALLPEDLRDSTRLYDKKGLDKLMTEIARTRPELYAPIAKQLGDVGRHQAYFRGETFTLNDFKPVHDRQQMFDELDAREREIDLNPDPDARRQGKGELYGEMSDRVSKETNSAALARRNNIALTVLTGARGKEAQLRDLISTPGFYPDAVGRPIPWFIRNSFAEGLRPADYLAGSYGARSSVVSSKIATAKGGFLAKTLSRAAATHLISATDCGTSNGIDLPLDEPDIRGRVLQRGESGYPAGTVIDRRVLARLKADKVPEVIVRSPLTCGAEHGLCSKCFGVKAEGQFPKIGEHVGITSANALGEPLCLWEGTEVRMADESVKKICEIAIGDTVWGSDLEGRLTPVPVLNVFNNGPRDCYITSIKVDVGQVAELISTSEHKVLCAGVNEPNYIDVIRNASYLQMPDDESGAVYSREYVGMLDTWDIEVDNDTHLFALANGLIVSNTQSALSMKHVTSGKGQKKEFSGLDYINQFMESPEEFKDRAAVSTVAGTVDSIEPAAQGGNYVVVAGERHYVPLDREITAEVGEQLEAGDSLTDGLVDVEDILRHKGLGEARRYWAERMAEMGKASAAGMDRRLFEVLARANVDHVQLADPQEEGFLPDDITRYSTYLHRRQLPDKIQAFAPKDAVGQYLEQPVLHHTVGTRITPRMADSIASKGFEKIFASDQEPSFTPQFVRLQQVAATSDDWLASLGGSYLGNQLQQGITRAQDTNIESNIHPVPRLAVGVGYADNLEQTGKF